MRFTFSLIIVLFLLYIISHIGLGIYHKRLMNLPQTPEIAKQVKQVGTIFKWYAFIYLAFVILLYYI